METFQVIVCTSMFKDKKGHNTCIKYAIMAPIKNDFPFMHINTVVKFHNDLMKSIGVIVCTSIFFFENRGIALA